MSDLMKVRPARVNSQAIGGRSVPSDQEYPRIDRNYPLASPESKMLRFGSSRQLPYAMLRQRFQKVPAEAEPSNFGTETNDAFEAGVKTMGK